MTRNTRGLIGIVAGVIVGLLLVKLANDVLASHGHVLKGGPEAIIVVVVAVLGWRVGLSTMRGDPEQ